MELLPYFKHAQKKVLKKGEVLHSSNETCRTLGYLVSGKLVMKKYLSTGKELFLTEFTPGELFGELLVLAGENYRGWLIAEEPTEVLELNSASLQELLEDAIFKRLFFSRISERVARMTERIEILSYKKISDRIVLYLLSHCEAGKVYDINITALAGSLDCSREALSRAISELEKEEVILKKGNTLQILDIPQLENQLTTS